MYFPRSTYYRLVRLWLIFNLSRLDTYPSRPLRGWPPAKNMGTGVFSLFCSPPEFVNDLYETLVWFFYSSSRWQSNPATMCSETNTERGLWCTRFVFNDFHSFIRPSNDLRRPFWSDKGKSRAIQFTSIVFTIMVDKAGREVSMCFKRFLLPVSNWRKKNWNFKHSFYLADLWIIFVTQNSVFVEDHRFRFLIDESRILQIVWLVVHYCRCVKIWLKNLNRVW